MNLNTYHAYVVVSDSNDNRVYSISNYNANYLKVRCGLNTYHCTYSNSDIRLKKNIKKGVTSYDKDRKSYSLDGSNCS